jgi:hypothetical protein
LRSLTINQSAQIIELYLFGTATDLLLTTR